MRVCMCVRHFGLDEMECTHIQLQQRILVSYILYSLYAPHPIAINPFKSVLLNTFLKEKDKAVASTVINPSAPSSPTSPTGSGKRPSENEQFVWVLWKILRGDGSDVCGFYVFFYVLGKGVADCGGLV